MSPMATKLKVLAAAVAMASLAFACTVSATTGDQQCGSRFIGSNGAPRECPNNLCCSAEGYCGIGKVYCAEGCQSGMCYVNDIASKRCGTNATDPSRVKCSNNYCCSIDEYCGLGSRYCGKGCQSGSCTTEIKRCDAKNECDNNLCCGVSRYNADGVQECGAGPTYCGDTCKSGPCVANGDAVCGADKPCTNGYCCGNSAAAPTCGVGTQYCCKNCLSSGGSCSPAFRIFGFTFICPLF